MRARICTLLLLLSLTASCTGAAGDDKAEDSPLEYPTGSTDVVLRLGLEGGFVPVQFNLTRLPDLTLYGDGRLIYPGPQILIYPGPALPNILVRRITPEGVAAIVREAVGAGLTGPDRNFQALQNWITDQPETVFTLAVNGETHSTRVYGLGSGVEATRVPQEEVEASERLLALRDRLTNLESWLPEGSVGPEEPYAAGELRVFVTDPAPAEEGLEQPPVVWPLAQPLAGFGSPAMPEGYRCGTISGEDLNRVLEAAGRANQLTPWESAGARFSLSFRPLLPDESGCPEPAA
ncbi:MAG TPA: hypothetical protein VHJ78_04065 [Actinomycetota bacterium]|nr:hypothetical protein [Actinomycetota bacterium]